MNIDNNNIYQNYANRLINEAAQPKNTQTTGIEGAQQFNENLAAIDQLEDSFNKFFETSVRTKFLTQQIAAQAKQVVGQTILGFLVGLVKTTKVKDPNQLDQMKKSIVSRIKGIDTSSVISLIDQMKGSPQSPAPQAAPVQEPDQQAPVQSVG